MNRYSSNSLFSTAILKSSLKRYMPVMFFAVLYYVVIYILPELLNMSGQPIITSDTAANGPYVGVRFYSAVMPLIISVPLFGFLHKNNASILIHSLPFTRMQIFISTVIAGFIIINIPNLLLAVYIATAVGAKIALKTLAFALLVTMFQLSICTLSAVVTGTYTMHIIMAVWFSLLPQSIYAVILIFSTAFLTGFQATDAGGVVLSMTPLTCRNLSLLSWDALIYLVSALILYTIAALAYMRLKTERCETAVTFNWVKWVLNILAGIYMMTVVGVIFFMAYVDSFVMIPASLAGAIIGVIIGYMLLNRTFKIFRGRFLRNMAVMVVICMAFLMTFTLDVYGYEDNVPSVNEVESVKLYPEGILVDNTLDEKVMDSDYNIFTDRDVISNVVKIHEKIVDGQYDTASLNNEDFDNYRSFIMKYTLKDGSSVSRRYMIPYKDVTELKYIYESGEFKDQMSIENTKAPIRACVIDTSEGDYIHVKDVTESKEIEELIKCMDEDFISRTFEEQIYFSSKIGISIDFMDYYSGYSIVRDGDEKTIDFLLDNGYIIKSE